MRFLTLIPLVLMLSACSINIPLIGRNTDRAAEPAAVAVSPGADDLRPTERPGEGVAGEVAASRTTLATLGDATEAGFWLDTPLVTVEGPGRVTTEDGAAVDVTLRPTGAAAGAGSRLSLQAMQALGLPLTAVVELNVEAF